MTTIHSEQRREIELLHRLPQADAARLDERFASRPMPEKHSSLFLRRLLTDAFDLSGMKCGLRNFLPRKRRANLLEVNADGTFAGEAPERQLGGRGETELDSGTVSAVSETWLAVRVVRELDVCRWTLQIATKQLTENTSADDEPAPIGFEPKSLRARPFARVEKFPKAFQRSGRAIQIQEPQVDFCFPEAVAGNGLVPDKCLRGDT
jgi:hypothetical protein